MPVLDKTYVFDVGDYIWNITYKKTSKDRLAGIMERVAPKPLDLTKAIDRLIDVKLAHA